MEDPDVHYFMKYYGGDGNQSGVDMLALNDGTFILLGNSEPNNADSHLYLVRVSADGETIWEVEHGLEEGHWTARDMEPTIDGNFVVVADYRPEASLPGVPEDLDIKLIKFSVDGNVLTEATQGTPGNEYSRTITPLSDGSFVVSGSTDSTRSFQIAGETDPDLFNAFNMRVDQNFVRFPSASEFGWIDVFVGFDNIDVAVKAFERSDGTFYVFGHTNSTLTGGLNPLERMGLWYYSRQSGGGKDKIWYPGNVVAANDTEINFVQSVGQSFGGGYLIVGTSQNTSGASQVFLARLRQSLTFAPPLDADAIFYNTISFANPSASAGRNVRGVSAATSTSGELGFLILGNEVRITGATNIWLAKINQFGDVLWATTLGSEAEDDRGAAVVELPDGKIAILGTMGLAENQTKMALIKVNSTGQFVK